MINDKFVTMFSFFKSTKSAGADFSFLHTDMHSHIISKIDDGARSEEESQELVKGLLGMGFSKLITTPHTFQDYYPNTPETIKAGLQILNETLAKNEISTEITAASEYYGDEYLLNLLNTDAQILTFGDNFVLFEVSMLAESPLVQEVIFSLKTRTYKPILAHPERYLYYQNKEVFATFDVSLQVNLLSLAGFYGKAQKKLALHLIDNDLVDFLGTDIHHASQLPFLEKLLRDKRTMKLLRSKQFKNQEL